MSMFRAVPWWGQLAWVVLIVGVLARIITTRIDTHSVVPIYLNAAVRWQAGADLYERADPLDLYRNPPLVAAMFTPFTALPLKLAAILWQLFNLIIYLSGFVQFVQSFYPALSRLQYGFLFSSVAFLILPSFNNGQMNLLIAGCVVWSIVLQHRGELWACAFWVSLAIVLKVYPISLGLLLGLRTPKLYPRLVATITLALAMPFAFGEWQYVARMHERYVEFTQLEQYYRYVIGRVYWDWTIILNVWLNCIATPTFTKAIAMLAGLACAIRVLQQPAPIVVLAVSTIWMTLFGPATEASTYTLLAPVVGLLLVTTQWHRSPIIYVLMWLAYGAHLQPIVRGLFPTSSFLRGQSAQALGTIVLLIRLRMPDRYSNVRVGSP